MWKRVVLWIRMVDCLGMHIEMRHYVLWDAEFIHVLQKNTEIGQYLQKLQKKFTATFLCATVYTTS